MRTRIMPRPAGLALRAGEGGGATARVMRVARLCAVLAGILAAVFVPAGPASASTSGVYWCVESHSPWNAYRERPPVPHSCDRGYIIARIPSSGTTQLVTVGAASYGTSWATLNTFAWAGGRWVHQRGPWAARIGQRGMAPPGRKTEGDLRTPQGTYGFGFMFGVLANPKVRFAWRHAYRYDYWDDDPASPLYNEWVDIRHQAPGASPEPMHQVPVYDYAAVIAYNTARVPGAGSAIFLHVGGGSATAGCVSLPVTRLLVVLRWLNPARHPVIAMQVIP
jgi:L,D-peptidoglycan transpeptidase YkuD (ErfK/YbiS/YcfS/YnhG family)